MWVRLEIRLQDNVTLHVGTHVGVEQNVILQCVKRTVYSVHYTHSIHALNTREWCMMKHGLHCALHNTIHFVCIVYVQWTVLNIEWILCFVKSMRRVGKQAWGTHITVGFNWNKNKNKSRNGIKMTNAVMQLDLWLFILFSVHCDIFSGVPVMNKLNTI